MKLVRYGRPGAERPGAIDAEGTLHDLSRVLKDVTPAALAPPTLRRLRGANLARLPVVRGSERVRAASHRHRGRRSVATGPRMCADSPRLVTPISPLHVIQTFMSGPGYSCRMTVSSELLTLSPSL